MPSAMETLSNKSTSIGHDSQWSPSEAAPSSTMMQEIQHSLQSIANHLSVTDNLDNLQSPQKDSDDSYLKMDKVTDDVFTPSTNNFQSALSSQPLVMQLENFMPSKESLETNPVEDFERDVSNLRKQLHVQEAVMSSRKFSSVSSMSLKRLQRLQKEKSHLKDQLFTLGSELKLMNALKRLGDENIGDVVEVSKKFNQLKKKEMQLRVTLLENSAVALLRGSYESGHQSGDIEKLTAEISTKNKDLAELKQKLDKVKVEHKGELAREIENKGELTRVIETKDKEISGLKTDATTAVRKLKTVFERYHQDVGDLMSSTDIVTCTDLITLVGYLESLMQRIEHRKSVEEKLSKITLRENELQKELEKEQAEVAQLRSEKTRLQQDLMGNLAQVQALEDCVANVQTELKTKITEIQTLKHQVTDQDELNSKYAALCAEHDRVKRDGSQLVQAHQASADRIKNLELQLANSRFSSAMAGTAGEDITTAQLRQDFRAVLRDKEAQWETSLSEVLQRNKQLEEQLLASNTLGHPEKFAL